MKRKIILCCVLFIAPALGACSQRVIERSPLGMQQLAASIQSTPYDREVPRSLRAEYPSRSLVVDTISVGSREIRVLGFDLTLLAVWHEPMENMMIVECPSGMYKRNYIYIIIYNNEVYLYRVVALPPDKLENYVVVDQLPTMNELARAIAENTGQPKFIAVDKTKIYTDPELIDALRQGGEMPDNRLLPLEGHQYDQ